MNKEKEHLAALDAAAKAAEGSERQGRETAGALEARSRQGLGRGRGDRGGAGGAEEARAGQAAAAAAAAEMAETLEATRSAAVKELALSATGREELRGRSRPLR